MSTVPTPLPDFDRPPVAEVVLSVQFETLSKLRSPQIGLLWQEFREQFPVTEEHPPINTEVERFGVPRPARVEARIEMLQSFPVPRCWFLSDGGTELIQVQQDRFIHNWRKVGEQDKYPRYEHLRRVFASELEQFRAFLDREQIGDFAPNQCEVTYVNHIVANQGWTHHGELGEVLTVFDSHYSDKFLSLPEKVRTKLTHVIANEAGEPLGRLHVTVEPAFRVAGDQPMWVMNLTARTRPFGDTIDGVLNSMDVGREWVVRGFASLTTEKMHKIWGRRDGIRHS